MSQQGETVVLPGPSHIGKYSLEQLLSERRSIREYPDKALTLIELGQLLWSAQGISHPKGLRTAPSAGALYPLELFVSVSNVDGLKGGVYHYQPQPHQLRKISDADVRKKLAEAALSQQWVEDAAAVVIITADYDRTTRKYGKRGKRYVHIEVGHTAQNLFLQSGAMELATVVVGAFNDREVIKALGLSDDLEALLLMPVGRK